MKCSKFILACCFILSICVFVACDGGAGKSFSAFQNPGPKNPTQQSPDDFESIDDLSETETEGESNDAEPEQEERLPQNDKINQMIGFINGSTYLMHDELPVASTTRVYLFKNTTISIFGLRSEHLQDQNSLSDSVVQPEGLVVTLKFPDAPENYMPLPDGSGFPYGRVFYGTRVSCQKNDESKIFVFFKISGVFQRELSLMLEFSDPERSVEVVLSDVEDKSIGNYSVIPECINRSIFIRKSW
jgi:hypothetical protein